MVSIVKVAAPTVAIADIGKAVIDRTPRVVVDAQIDALFNINNVYTTTSMPVHFWSTHTLNVLQYANVVLIRSMLSLFF